MFLSMEKSKKNVDTKNKDTDWHLLDQQITNE
jgi:hypothetical protein